ncbi:hypothetical protein BDA96_06G044200 [Sorghum bicolor]|uniref:F-box domain-containing protein n=1 Tax=Sorghum bicolor TaxID=4558 RepID=A0A921QNF1_SORBI|nr:hypothetical protein BDA96_06G044200 [Sorghum bicolor]
MLPLLLISKLPAFMLLLIAPATKACCKLTLLALLLATELLRHATAVGTKERERGARMSSKPRPALVSPPPAEAEAAVGFPLLDLPELALDRVLEELSPASLTAMACMCAPLRDRCSTDAPWEHHLRLKWGHVLGTAARKEWEAELLGGRAARGSAAADPPQELGRDAGMRRHHTPAPSSAVAVEPTPTHGPAAPPTDTVAAWYRALECGEFWIPAQV